MVSPANSASVNEAIRNPLNRPYEPFGSAVKMLYSKHQENLLCGPAGTGKSRVCLEKLHLCASKYAGMRALMVRKTRESLTQSAMVTFDKFVVPPNGSVRWRTAEQEYRYSNGSVIVVGGMDKSSKVLSSDYDLIYVQEATELMEEDWETLITRARLGVMPYNQLIADCNPSAPYHWLKKRADAGILNYIASIHEDNPTLYDNHKKVWTKRGEDYLKKLDSLTGVRYRRLRLGLWAAAEGQIYDMWDPDIHMIKRFDPPRDWNRVWVVDFGFKHPFVFQAWAISPEGRCYRFFEIYYTKLLVEDAARLISAWQKANREPTPDAVVCDWDAEGRATLERYLEVTTSPADKGILEGLEAVKSMLKPDEDGVPNMLFMRDSLMEVDPDLSDSARPTCTEQEMDGYEWDDRKKREIPRDEDNHGMDCIRYLAKYVQGEYGDWALGMSE
jgi:PBSX family phage terminase large subunit